MGQLCMWKHQILVSSLIFRLLLSHVGHAYSVLVHLPIKPGVRTSALVSASSLLNCSYWLISPKYVLPSGGSVQTGMGHPEFSLSSDLLSGLDLLGPVLA